MSDVERDALAMPAGFSWPTRVYWEDTDAGGVVHHGRYVAFLERARTEWLRALGYGQELLRDRDDLVLAIRSMAMDFRRPARLDDLLQVTCSLRECRRASAVFVQEVRRDGEVLVGAEVRAAALHAGSFRPRALPDEMHAVLKALENDAG